MSKKLSELFEEICNEYKQDEKVECNINNEKHKFLINLNRQCSFIEYENNTGNSVDYLLKDEFLIEMDYIKAFLTMCEELLDGKIPTLNRFNKGKFNELEDKEIIKVLKNQEEVSYATVEDRDLLEDEYNNIRYKVNGGHAMNNNVVHNNDYSVKFEKSTVNNSGNISGANSTSTASNNAVNTEITDENLPQVINAIKTLILNDTSIAEELKDELVTNKNDKPKLKETLTKIATTISSNVAVGLLVEKANEFLG